MPKAETQATVGQREVRKGQVWGEDLPGEGQSGGRKGQLRISNITLLDYILHVM